MRWGQNIASHKSGSVIASCNGPKLAASASPTNGEPRGPKRESWSRGSGRPSREGRGSGSAIGEIATTPGDFLRVFHLVGDRDRSTIGMADENRPIEAHLVCRVDRFGLHPQACLAARARAKAVTGRSKATIWLRGTKAS